MVNFFLCLACILAVIVYLAYCAMVVWITNFKMIRARKMAFLGSFLITPVLFLLIALPILYIKEVKENNLK